MNLFGFLQAMFSSNNRFHRHRRKLFCHFLKAVLLFFTVSMIATHTILIKEISKIDFYNQSRSTKGINTRKRQDRGRLSLFIILRYYLESTPSEMVKLVNRRSSQLRLQENSLNTLIIKVTSSKDNVSVTVDNTVVSLQ